MEGFVLYRDTFPGGPIGYFSDVSQWTFVYMIYVFTVQTLLGDGVVVGAWTFGWRSNANVIIALSLLCGVAVETYHDRAPTALVCCWRYVCRQCRGGLTLFLFFKLLAS